MTNTHAEQNPKTTMSMEGAFHVFSSSLNHEARSRLYQLKEHYEISKDDPIWSVLLAIDYHTQLAGKIPEELAKVSDELFESLNEVSLHLNELYAELEAEIAQGAEDAVTEGLNSVIAPHREDLRVVLEALENVPLHKSVVETLDREIDSVTNQGIQTSVEAAESAVRSLKYYASDILSVRISTRIVLSLAGGILLMLLLCAFTLVLDSHSWSQENARDAYTQSEHDQMQREDSFYQGLDDEGKREFRLNDERLPAELRLYYRHGK